ncbi:DUF2851 family protein [Algoriphagus namhaensis]
MEFREDFLQLVWKYQYFDKRDLKTTQGEPIEIIRVGFHNLAEGPDFRDSCVKVAGIELHGHVEIHRMASDWKQHAHMGDPAYNSVILHVVWENDREALRNDGTTMPTLELKGKIFLNVWKKYQQMLDFKQSLPCSDGLSAVPEIIKFSTLEKALVERLQEKSSLILAILQSTQNDWEETAYRWLFTCFGFKTNAVAMAELAERVPYKLLKKHRTQLPALEALLFGQAGLLPEKTDEPYVLHLKKEYDFFQEKYRWRNSMNRQDWQFTRVRPSNFPTQRIAQLASILSHAPGLLQSIFEDSQDFGSFKSVLQVEPGDYWKFHFSFGTKSLKATSRGISNTVLQLLMINFVVPLWFAYGRYFEQPDWQERCFDLLQSLPPESNSIIRNFEKENWIAQNGFDAQGMIGLYKNHCALKKCLQCKVAQSLIKAEA